MKKNRFLIVSIVLLLLVLAGGVYKQTALKDQRTELAYHYKVVYTVLVPNVDSEFADMYFEKMGLYLDEQTPAGTVSTIEKKPAASGAEDQLDITLTVSASGLRLSKQSRGTYSLPQDQLCHFVSRFIDFDGYITQVEEE
jgi:hypothetical protein